MRDPLNCDFLLIIAILFTVSTTTITSSTSLSIPPLPTTPSPSLPTTPLTLLPTTPLPPLPTTPSPSLHHPPPTTAVYAGTAPIDSVLIEWQPVVCLGDDQYNKVRPLSIVTKSNRFTLYSLARRCTIYKVSEHTSSATP